jgi:(1->4)-alpha-D-glucan 1-alpha-D-glucosylmutase
VYRTYVTAADGASAQDRRYIEWATARAKKASPAADTSVFDFLRDALTGDLAANAGYRPEAVFRVAMRAQQISGPVMAKGMEDTAFYRYARLISLNEVGGDPRRFGVSLAAFHHTNQARRERWPLDMLASSTHDTKRGEDGRARINLLSEIPTEWARRVLLWSRLNRSRRTEGNGDGPTPHPHDEYLFYQSLVGAWPIAGDAASEPAMSALAERVDAFMRKAVREGKERSSWGNPNQPYEEALSRFVRGALEISPTNPFPEEFAGFIARIARWGTINGLAQTLVKLTLPGVPDTYQGSELWDFSLVDPDNRRPVDFALRRHLLDAAAPGDWRDGGEKLRLIRAVLQFRRREPALFANGSYDAVPAEGERADHVCAFARSHADRRIVTVVPRLVARLGAGGSDGEANWQGTVLRPPDGDYRELFTGRRFRCADSAIPLARLLDDFPVALLIAE